MANNLKPSDIFKSLHSKRYLSQIKNPFPSKKWFYFRGKNSKIILFFLSYWLIFLIILALIYAVNLENEKMKKYLALSVVVLGLSACSVVEDYNLNPLGWFDGGSDSSSE